MGQNQLYTQQSAIGRNRFYGMMERLAQRLRLVMKMRIS